ncbi:MAG: helix-turn-helix transcriptional regulator [Rhodospirillales bacterium]|nr:helix-turn-helix transcriptional regulator [Rhodospirillales bacterium]
MRSYRPHIDARRKKFVDLIGRVHLEIGNAVHDWTTAENVSKTDLARILGCNKSVLSRRLNGTANLTLKTIADLAWATGRDIDFALPKAAHRNVPVQAPRPVVTRVSATTTTTEAPTTRVVTLVHR